VRVTWRVRDFVARLIFAGIIAASLVVSARQSAAREIPPEETKAIQLRLSGVSSAEGARLASALGIEGASKEPPPDFVQNYLQDLGDLDGDGISEYALEWSSRQPSAPGSSVAEDSAPLWALFLLAWDGTHWQVSPLMGGFEPFTLEVLPASKSCERAIAVVVQFGATGIPYPAIFRIQAHSARLVWDGRSDDSRYQGYDYGRVQFRMVNGALQMVATGRADPGFLVFPKTGGRGFDAQTVYIWEGESFIPVRTEYSPNRDFTLYRFIAALHLHDFRTAYSLIDAGKFLKTDKPGPAAFRKIVEDNFPEFLDDQIFIAQDSSPDDDTFRLELPDKVYVYTPAFSGSSGVLLSGLERQEHKREDP
jgi:hypothetical protein